MLLDHFNNGVVDLAQRPGTGQISESGTQLRLYCPPNANCIFWDNSPFVYMACRAPQEGQEHLGPFRFETRLDSLTYTSVSVVVGLLICRDEAPSAYAYDFGYYPSESKVIVSTWNGGAGARAASSAVVSAPNGTVKHVYRCYVNPTAGGFLIPEHDQLLPAGNIGFSYSIDGGATFTWLYKVAHPFTLGWIGPSLRQTVTGITTEHIALFDYFAAQNYYWDNTKIVSSSDLDPRTQSAVSDEARFVSGGTKDYLQGISRGSIVPGSQSDGMEASYQPVAGAVIDTHQVWLPPETALVPGKSVGDEDKQIPLMGAEDDLSFPEGGGGTFLSAELFEGRSGFLFRGTEKRQTLGVEDELVISREDADFAVGGLDTEGKTQLYSSLRDVTLFIPYDAASSFDNPTAHNHWGAARDGKFYADGVECGSEGYDFGTLANGFKRTAWRFAGGLMEREPVFATTPTKYRLNLIADDELDMALISLSSAWDLMVVSHGKFYLDGDIDIEVEYTDYAYSSGRIQFNLYKTRYTVATHFGVWARSNNIIDAQRSINGTAASLGTVTPCPTAARLRLTRTANVFQAYKWDSGDTDWVAVGSSYSHASLEGALYVGVGLYTTGGYSCSCRLKGFTINAGTVLNTASWARELPGDHRGSQSAMPQNMVIAAESQALSIIDADNALLWMRFLRGVSFAFYELSGNALIRDLAWKDGILLMVVGRDTLETAEGFVLYIDFTIEAIRYHRPASSTVCGSFFSRDWEQEPGVIVNRNRADGWVGDYDAWHVISSACRCAAILHDAGYHYRASGTVSGITVHKWLHWNLNGIDSTTFDWDLNYSRSTGIGEVFRCAFWGTTLYFGDATHLHSRDKTNGSLDGWEDKIGSTFSPEYSQAWPEAAQIMEHYRPVFWQPAIPLYIFIARASGIYRIEWPTGAWELFYGAGAVHDILPSYTQINSIAFANDGASDLLVVGLQDASLSKIVILRLTDHTIYGVSSTASSSKSARMVSV